MLLAYQESVVYLSKASCACDGNIILLYIMNNDEIYLQKESFHMKIKLYALKHSVKESQTFATHT